MSYDLMVLDKRKRFKNKKEFLEWYNVLTEWNEDVDYSDYKHATSSLQNWFLAMKDIVPPLNGEFASEAETLENGEFSEGDYCIASEAIYVAFAWSDAEKVHPIVEKLAKQHDVAFFDIPQDRVYYPDGFVLDLSEKGDSAPSIFKKISKLFRF